jgi:hypothetical protein
MRRAQTECQAAGTFFTSNGVFSGGQSWQQEVHGGDRPEGYPTLHNTCPVTTDYGQIKGYTFIRQRHGTLECYGPFHSPSRSRSSALCYGSTIFTYVERRAT